MIIIQDAVISFIGKIKSAQTLHKVIAIVLATVILVSVALLTSGIKLSYNVKLGDTVLARVASNTVYEQALAKSGNHLGVKDFEAEGIKVTPVLSFGKNLNTAEEVSKLLLESSENVVNGFTVSVDGKVVANVKDRAAVDKAAADRLASFNIEGAECESSFSKKLSVAPAYFHADLLSADDAAVNAINAMDVVTVATSKTVITVSFDTETQGDNTKDPGYHKLVTEGVNGENQSIETVTYLNGVATSEPEVSEIVLKYPINEVIVVGTKNAYVSSAPQNAAGAGFVHPLAGKGVITSHYGDTEYRGKAHGGIDLGVDVGTPVVAAKAGTVVEVGNNKYYSYGCYVIIDHGNGLKTRYAHNNKNLVTVGQTVATGQIIAYSGNTGRSTGPHLHFEILNNGVCINPAYYIKF